MHLSPLFPDDDDDSYERREEETNEIGKEAESKGDQGNKPVTIMGQPGILAGECLGFKSSYSHSVMDFNKTSFQEEWQ